MIKKHFLIQDNYFYVKSLFCVILGGAIFLIPCPHTIDPKGWTLFAIFISTIAGLILKPLPMGPVSLIGLCVATLTGTLEMSKESLSGLGSPTIWLIVFVFFIARAFIKTHLGVRIAYNFVRFIGKSALGLSYGLSLTEFLLAPLIPSNSARAGGIMLPIVRSISESLGSYPHDGTQNRIGSFLIQVAFQSNIITSAMFLTAMAANPLSQSIAAKQGISISWTKWAVAAIVPGIFSLIIVPLVLYYQSPPELKTLSDSEKIAKKQLEQMGPISKQEILMILIFCLMLVCWIFADVLAINPSTTALMGLVLLLFTRVLDWKDILNEHEAWSTLMWLSTLVTMSSFLDKFGFIKWFSESVQCCVSGFSPIPSLLGLGLVYFYSHYFFASNTAHASSMYGPFLCVAIASGAPPLLSALLFGFFNSLFSSMTHYGTTPAPILFGAGYVNLATWWKNGFIISIVNLTIWLLVGGLWWKVLGIW
jgi:DASS family divalent anion:Na+ symporter